MEHIEEAGIHSGDSACALPPITLGATDVAAVRHATGELAAPDRRARPAQRPVRAQGRRAVRARGQPAGVADGAVRVQGDGGPAGQGGRPDRARRDRRRAARGGSAAATGDGGDLPADAPVAVKEAVLPFHRFRRADGSGVDSVLGPEMRSTGEVMGLDAAFGTAFAKSQAAAYGSLPTGGTVVRLDRQPGQAGGDPAGHAAGRPRLRILATEGTALALRRHGVPVEVVAQAPAGHGPSSRLRAADPGRRASPWCSTRRGGRPGNSGPRLDGYEIRTAAVAAGIPCLTTVQGMTAVRAGHRGADPRGDRRALAAGAARPAAEGTGDGGSSMRRSRSGAARPVQVRGEVLARRRVGAYHLFEVARRRDRRAVPARAVRRAVGRRAGLGAAAAPVLRALPGHPDGAFSGTVQFVVGVHGRGTEWLAGVRPGEPLDLVGPLGTAVPAARPRRPAACWSAAGTARRRCSRWPTRCGPGSAGSTSLLGAGTADRVFGELEAKRTAGAVDGHHRRRLGRPARHGGRRAARRARADRARRPSTRAARCRCCARSARSPRSYGLPCQVAVEESMACGIGVCMTCVLPVVGEDGVTRMVRSCVDGPVFRGRPGPVGRRRHGAGGRARRGRDGCGDAADRRPRRGRPADRARRRHAAQPGAHRVRLRRRRPGAGASSSPVASLGAVVTKSIMLAPRAGRPTPRMAETPSGMLNSIGLQSPGHRRVPRARPALAGRARRPGGGHHRRRQRRRLRRAGPAAAARPALVAIEVNISCPNVEDRGQVFACDPRRGRPGDRPRSGPRRRPGSRCWPSCRPTSPTSSPSPGPACGAGADGLTLINTLLGLVIDPDTHAPGAGRHHRRAVRAGDPAGRGALRVAGARGAARRADPRRRRHPQRAGRAAVRARRGVARCRSGTAVFGDPSAPARVLAELRAALAERGFAVADASVRTDAGRRTPTGPRPATEQPPMPVPSRERAPRWRLGADDL